MVYLVDDDIDDLEIVTEALMQNNYKGPVGPFSNGQELMEKLGESDVTTPDLIVMDLNMPFKNGFEALRELKSDPTYQTIPVIILTSSTNKDDENRCFELGCDYFYTKPSSMAGYVPLVSVVKRFISRGTSNG